MEAPEGEGEARRPWEEVVEVVEGAGLRVERARTELKGSWTLPGGGADVSAGCRTPPPFFCIKARPAVCPVYTLRLQNAARLRLRALSADGVFIHASSNRLQMQRLSCSTGVQSVSCSCSCNMQSVRSDYTAADRLHVTAAAQSLPISCFCHSCSSYVQSFSRICSSTNNPFLQSIPDHVNVQLSPHKLLQAVKKTP